MVGVIISKQEKSHNFARPNFYEVFRRYLPGKMMTDVALNIHFKVGRIFRSQVELSLV